MPEAAKKKSVMKGAGAKFIGRAIIAAILIAIIIYVMAVLTRSARAWFESKVPTA